MSEQCWIGQEKTITKRNINRDNNQPSTNQPTKQPAMQTWPRVMKTTTTTINTPWREVLPFAPSSVLPPVICVIFGSFVPSLFRRRLYSPLHLPPSPARPEGYNLPSLCSGLWNQKSPELELVLRSEWSDAFREENLSSHSGRAAERTEMSGWWRWGGWKTPGMKGWWHNSVISLIQILITTS